MGLEDVLRDANVTFQDSNDQHVTEGWIGLECEERFLCSQF